MRFPALLTILPAFLIAFNPALAEQAQVAEPNWAFEDSDIRVDPAFHFGVLPNGMRYILRTNATPEGTALVRLNIGSGSLDETETERGLAHFLEHMAFNGSKRIPEGEMIKLLEREGLAFGADTNAATGLERTLYMLNLPRNDPALLDTALMLMRETASELLIEQDAVDRERGIVLAERRDRRNFAYKQLEDQFEFAAPNARFKDRLPIGTLDVLENASAADIRGYYARNYVPENTVLVVVGDFPVELLEERVKHWFADWQPAPDPAEPQTGPVDVDRRSDIDIYTDPALPENITVTRYGPWIDEPDTIANRQQGLLRRVGYGIINRRLAALARGADAPFRGASFGTSDVFEDARATTLSVSTADGEWQNGLVAAATTVREALAFGFSQAEVDEQLARLRTSLQDNASASKTRSNSALVSLALGLVDNDTIPSTPESALERFEAFADRITPEAAHEAVLEESVRLLDPLIRYQGREQPAGGREAILAAWDAAMSARIAAPELGERKEFAYQDFGAPGRIVSDTRDDRFGFRLIRFANGLRLNLKQTDIREDRISFRLTLDGGDLLNTAEDPLKTALFSSLSAGGLGAHSQDELESILAGRSVRLSLTSLSDAFRMSGTTTPRDLELQLQLLAAGLTDPGYRSEGVERYRRSIAQFFASLDATPGQALGNRIGGILSDNDPRFTLQPETAYAERSFEQLAADVGDRLANGAIELALVGDLDEDSVIATVAATLGALPPREAEFNAREEARQRKFTDQRGTRVLTHTGEADQALIRIVWPTTDDSDLTEALRLNLLAHIVEIKLQEKLREELGQAYSPSAGSSTSRVWRGYGTFSLNASVEFVQLEAAREAIGAMLTELRDGQLDEDTVNRARRPMLEDYDNILKSLGGWMSFADRAQSEGDRLDRYFAAPDILKAFRPGDLVAAVRQYLGENESVEILVVPKGDESTLQPQPAVGN